MSKNVAPAAAPVAEHDLLSPETKSSTTDAAPTPALRPAATSVAAPALLTLLSGGQADALARLVASGRTVDGFGTASWQLPVRERTALDLSLLGALEDNTWAVHVALAVHDESGQVPIRLHAVSAAWTVATQYRDGRWQLSQDALTATYTRLNQFAIQPAMIVLGGWPIAGQGFSLTALFRLAAPLKVQGLEDHVRALDLLRRLARRLDADVPGPDRHLAQIGVPLPGSLIREQSAHRFIVTATLGALDASSSLEQLEAAIAQNNE